MTDSTDAVLIEHHDPGMLVVTFNRPETMNAFSSEMSAAFTTALRDADTDDAGRRGCLVKGGLQRTQTLRPERRRARVVSSVVQGLSLIHI